MSLARTVQSKNCFQKKLILFFEANSNFTEKDLVKWNIRCKKIRTPHYTYNYLENNKHGTLLVAKKEQNLEGFTSFTNSK